MSEDKDRSEERFDFSYSAKDRDEIKKIRDKYVPEPESKLEQLRRLDESASRPGTAAAIILGIAGVLLLGIGMSCTMVWNSTMFVPGIIIGALGIVCVVAAHPVYQLITRKRREKIAPEIMRLTDELLK